MQIFIIPGPLTGTCRRTGDCDEMYTSEVIYNGMV